MLVIKVTNDCMNEIWQSCGDKIIECQGCGLIMLNSESIPDENEIQICQGCNNNGWEREG
jgi:hypothetical protein